MVLEGRPTLRTPEGTREFASGRRSVHFPGRPGSGRTRCGTSRYDVARFVMVSTRGAPEVVEYPDLGQLTVQAPTGSQTGRAALARSDDLSADT